MEMGAYGATSGSDERESRPLMEPLIVVSLPEEVRALRAEPQWAENHKNARTLAKDVDFRALLSVLGAGEYLEEFNGEARASLQVVDGSIRLDVDGQQTDLTAGQIAVIDSGRPWTVVAATDCAILLTLAWPLEKAGV